MKSIKLQRAFNELSKDFRTNSFNMNTVVCLVEEIRYGIPELTQEEIELLLSIPLSVLKSDIDIQDYKKWQHQHREYFSENLCSVDDKFFIEKRRLIKYQDFYLDDIIEIAEFIKDNYSRLVNIMGKKLEIPLRNVEVAIRDDAKYINERNFLASGNIFADYIDKAISL